MAHDVKYVSLTEENFDREVLQSSQPVLVDFWAAWCGPCRLVAPAVEELAAEFEGIAKIAKLNVDDAPQVAARFGIQSIPTLLFFRGGQVVDGLVGAVPKAAMADRLNGMIARA